MITKKSIFAMSLVVCARNVTRINQKTGSIVQHAIVISRTRLASNFMLKYRPKAIQPVRQTYYRCCMCSTTVNRNKSRQLHVCGHKYCDTCKMFMSKDHVCYMKTTDEEEATRKLKRKRKKRVEEDDDVQKWIVFDFECTQDELIQCNEGHKPRQRIVCGNCNQSDCHAYPCQHGYLPKKMTMCENCQRPSCGSFRHVPNLFVVRKVCE